MSQVKFCAHDHNGDLMVIGEWLEAVHKLDLVDYDGYGYWSTEEEKSNVLVRPSDITARKAVPPEWATHVIWYNK